jgi:hypothetical protein
MDYHGTGVQFSGRKNHIFLPYNLRAGSKTHPASNPMGIWALSRGVKRSEHEADHSSNAEVKNSEAIPTLPSTSSRSGA